MQRFPLYLLSPTVARGRRSPLTRTCEMGLIFAGGISHIQPLPAISACRLRHLTNTHRRVTLGSRQTPKVSGARLWIGSGILPISEENRLEKGKDGAPSDDHI